MEADDEAIKILACGDGAIGKTCLLISYQSQEFPKVHIPTIFENKTIDKEVPINGQPATISIDLWDTAGQEEFDRLRILAYPGTNFTYFTYFTYFAHAVAFAVKHLLFSIQQHPQRGARRTTANTEPTDSTLVAQYTQPALGRQPTAFNNKSIYNQKQQ